MNDQINEAVDLLKKGELIAFPTETVYGLGADAENIGAVIKIYKIKKRPSFNPLICHFKNINLLKKQVIFSEEAKKLAKIFWPGPLTIILKKLYVILYYSMIFYFNLTVFLLAGLYL